MAPRFLSAGIVLALLAALAPAAAAPPARKPAEPSLSTRLRGVANTCAKWGLVITPSAQLKGPAGPFDASLKFTPTLQDDAMKLELEGALGERDGERIALKLTVKADGTTGKTSATGSLSLKGTPIGGGLQFDEVAGWSMDVAAETALSRFVVTVGEDGKRPLKLTLKLGLVDVGLDPVKYYQRGKEVLPGLLQAGKEKVGGVLIQVDTDLLSAALRNAPLPLDPDERSLTAVSLRRLLPVYRVRPQTALPITAVRGLVIDRQSGDVQFLGIKEPHKPEIRADVLVALLRSVWRDGLQPFVSLDTLTGSDWQPRVGGVSPGLEKSRLMANLLDADYAMKSVLFRTIRVPGVPSLPEAVANRAASSTAAVGTGRFWYAPRPVERGDVTVSRSSAAVVVRFDTAPRVLAASMRANEGPGAQSHFDVVGEWYAGELTRRMDELEEAGLFIKELRQAFELSLAASVLRVEELPAACRQVLTELAKAPVPEVEQRTGFPIMRGSARVPGTTREIGLFGGVEAGYRVSRAGFQSDASLAKLTSARTAAWPGFSRKLAVGFQPEIISEQPLLRAELAEADLQRAREEYHAQDYPAALQSAADALAADPGCSPARELRCAIFMAMIRWDEALAEAETWVKLAPNETKAYYWRGVAHNVRADYPAANRDASEAIRRSPKAHLPYTLRADLRRQQGDTKGALADLDEAVRLAPRSEFALDQRRELRRRLGDTAGALADASAALEINPLNLENLRERAALYRRLEKPEPALQDYLRLFSLDPRGENLSLVAVARMELKDLEGALRDISRAIELTPFRHQSHGTRSLIYQELKRYDEALADCRRALEILAVTKQDAFMAPVYEASERELLRLKSLQEKGLLPR